RRPRLLLIHAPAASHGAPGTPPRRFAYGRPASPRVRATITLCRSRQTPTHEPADRFRPRPPAPVLGPHRPGRRCRNARARLDGRRLPQLLAQPWLRAVADRDGLAARTGGRAPLACHARPARRRR